MKLARAAASAGSEIRNAAGRAQSDRDRAAGARAAEKIFEVIVGTMARAPLSLLVSVAIDRVSRCEPVLVERMGAAFSAWLTAHAAALPCAPSADAVKRAAVRVIVDSYRGES